MAKLELTVNRSLARIGDESVNDPFDVIRLSSYLYQPGDAESAMPILKVKTASGEYAAQDNCDAMLEISGYEEIDALRRFCEMALELFDKGRLE